MQTTKQGDPQPLSLAIVPGDLNNRAAAEASSEIDAADDREWLAAHPEESQRVRACSPRELVGFGCPPGSHVVVLRGPLGSTVRIVVNPESPVHR